MSRRLVAIALWFYAGWAFGALVAAALAINGLVGPVIGVLAASLVTFTTSRANPASQPR